MSGKTGALREESRAGEVGCQHRVLPLKKRDYRLDGLKIGRFQRQDLLDFASPRPLRLLDPGESLLQSRPLEEAQHHFEAEVGLRSLISP